jgi:hypothetical protein
MNEQQIGSRLYGKPRRGEAGIHCGGHARDCATVFDLKSVECAVVVVDLPDAQEAVAMFDNAAKRGAWHIVAN